MQRTYLPRSAPNPCSHGVWPSTAGTPDPG